jgi:C4-dicarboxylate transporter DctM subunit
MLLLVFLGAFIALLLIRVPIGVAMGTAGLAVLLLGGGQLSQAPSTAFSALDSFPFLAIPGFILAGEILTGGGISRRILEFSQAVVGRFRGSLGATAVVTSAAFGTVSGSSMATVAAVGGIMIPEMERDGQGREYPAALVAASGFLGILIPPSVPGIILAITAGLPIGRVWLATVGPAILLVVLYILVNYLVIGRHQDRSSERFQVAPYVAEVGRASWKAGAALLMPVIIFVGIYGGVFTPTEAAVVAVAYGMIVALMVYRSVSLRGMGEVLRSAALTSAAISILIAFAAIAGRMITVLGIPVELSRVVADNVAHPLVFLLIANVLLLVLGSFMETNTSILIVGPILFPVAAAVGIDPLHFAAIMLLNLEIGMITPPFAANLFLSAAIADTSIDRVIRSLIPFFLAALVVLAVTTLVPSFSLFLPELLG